MGLFEHKERLVIIDADAYDLAGFKTKYHHFGYAVTAVLIADDATRANFCGDAAHGAISKKRIAIYEEMYPHVPGMQHLDYIVTSPAELTKLLAHLRPNAVLTDYHLHSPAFPDGGLSVVQTLRAATEYKDIPMVLHAAEFDLKGKDPESVEVEALRFWITRKRDSDAHECFQRSLLEKRRADARRKYETAQ